MSDRVQFDVAPGEVFTDVETRTIKGLAVPVNQVARKGGQAFRFLPNSIEFGAYTPLLHGHTATDPVGRLTHHSWSARGLEVCFKVSNTARGTEMLELAKDGVLGLSVGVDFAPGGAKQVADEIHVSKAIAGEVSLTALPAFAASRIDSVTLAQDEGVTVADDAVVETPAAATSVTVNVDSEMIASAIVGSLRAAGVGDGPTPQPVPNAATSTREELPYRFDRGGNLTRGPRFDFSTDLISGSKGDREALNRAESFMRAQFDVDRADVAGLNPTRPRPDMYVDQREYQYPVWDAIKKGTLPDSSPFVFPRFNSSSGLVSEHTEGVEPTPGVFTATTTTVTPTAISGRVEITREAWDQGGNPQMSNLIWRQMERAWYEALEASAVSVLDAANPTAIALTAGGGTTGRTLDAELTAAFAALQFIRGGFSMDTMFTQIDLYKALISAQDGNGRRLYPALGPSNASGTVRSRFGALDINGVVAVPAWGLAATGSVAASSYLFDSQVVHGWATAPQRLNFEYRVAYVDLAIWGYKATAISDLNGVREITYDPAP